MAPVTEALAALAATELEVLTPVGIPSRVHDYLAGKRACVRLGVLLYCIAALENTGLYLAARPGISSLTLRSHHCSGHDDEDQDLRKATRI